MTVPPFAWTPERVDELRRRWKDGESCSQVAKAIGASRNAVIGKIHRLGLSGRVVVKTLTPKPVVGIPAAAPPVRPKLPAIQPLQRKRTPPAAPPPQVEAAPKDKCFIAGDRRTVQIHNLEHHHCRWPFDPKDEDSLVTYCGEPTFGCGPYCPAHARLSDSPTGGTHEQRHNRRQRN